MAHGGGMSSVSVSHTRPTRGVRYKVDERHLSAPAIETFQRLKALGLSTEAVYEALEPLVALVTYYRDLVENGEPRGQRR